jgi:hypothetical protein
MKYFSSFQIMSSSTYLFYDVMQYPVPFQKEFFAYEEVLDTVKKPGEVALSWAKPGEGLEEYVAYINKLGWLWRSLPFVEAIYLANSLTFNALHTESDIDLFFVVSPGRMWLARLMSNTIFFVLGLKRWRKRVRKKFCLSFYVSADALNLQSIKLQHSDPYLVYRLAHLVPLYMRLQDHPLDIYEHNYRLREYLPTFPMEQVIMLGSHYFSGSSTTKTFIERLLGGWIGNMIEWLVKIIRVPILLYKKKRLGRLGTSIIISDSMLKFHADRRIEYAMKRKISQKTLPNKK